ncbi:hypothetical protein ElyMa_004862500 [Elysia marginata]|uniref:Uncharacterized protein n=1 Tax=Elysia marginata TaxID=1093978 RepID=A0AAV4IPR9_9GAST|nr:hypothetical protein ElyMa_004862500 [Elysia marginata]
MKKKGKLYDLQDFEACVPGAGCKTVTMAAKDFSKWESVLSTYRLKKLEKRSFLNLSEMKEFQFRREQERLYFKTYFYQNNFTEFFLKSTFHLERPAALKKDRGVERERKLGIIKTLVPLTPEDRHSFWINILEC